jgi:hypothetical protein
MKFIANHLVTIHNLSTAEAFVLGEIAGLDPALVFDAIADSAGSSRHCRGCRGDGGAVRRSEMLMVRVGSPVAPRRVSATLLLD